jgi:hypothetical protein
MPPRLMAKCCDWSPEKLDGLRQAPSSLNKQARYEIPRVQCPATVISLVEHLCVLSCQQLIPMAFFQVVYTTACGDLAEDKEETVEDFVPMSVHYQERSSAAGKTSGGYIKRDAR